MLRRASLRAVQCVQTCVNYAQQAGDSLVLYICAIRHQLGQACPHLGRRPPLTDRQSTQGMKSKRLERRNLFAHGKLRRWLQLLHVACCMYGACCTTRLCFCVLDTCDQAVGAETVGAGHWEAEHTAASSSSARSVRSSLTSSGVDQATPSHATCNSARSDGSSVSNR